MAARGFDALRADTAREYLINLCPRLVYHVVRRDTELDRGRNNQPFPYGVVFAGFGNRVCQTRVDARQVRISLITRAGYWSMRRSSSPWRL